MKRKETKETIEYAYGMAKAVNNLDKHVQILIGDDGQGALYTLQQIKDEFKNMITNKDLREFELKHKRLLDQDWVFYWQY